MGAATASLGCAVLVVVAVIAIVAGVVGGGNPAGELLDSEVAMNELPRDAGEDCPCRRRVAGEWP